MFITTKTKAPKKWAQASDDELRNIKIVCLDIDETFSTKGKITAEAFSSLWALKKAGFGVVPITGRPAGWCDHIARFWPVDAVIGENGAFTFFMQHGVRRRTDTPGSFEDAKNRLSTLSEAILDRFPNAKWASDQRFREYDLAIDVAEDVEPWPNDDVDELLKICKTEGANAKLSSVHVNAWFGDYDKRKGLDHWLASDAPGWAGAKFIEDQMLFIGDSPNDEPMFGSFKYSVGVANLAKYIDRLEHPPKWMTEKESGAGFAEMAMRLVNLASHK